MIANKIGEHNIYLGSYHAALDSRFLYCSKITHIVDVGSDNPLRNDNIKQLKIYINDLPHEMICEYFEETFNFISKAISGGGAVLIHCYAGISRSTTILTWYLSKTFGTDILSTLLYIKKYRPQIDPNYGFVSQLLDNAKI